jgi:hypothetical protein
VGFGYNISLPVPFKVYYKLNASILREILYEVHMLLPRVTLINY